MRREEKAMFLLPILSKWGGGAAHMRSMKSATEGLLPAAMIALTLASDPSVILGFASNATSPFQGNGEEKVVASRHQAGRGPSYA